MMSLEFINELDSIPFLADENDTCLKMDDICDNKKMYCISPLHGRSYVLGKTRSGRYIVSKGNGLNYSQWRFLNTGEFGNDTWGLLLLQDANRDLSIGKEVESLGVKTNHMRRIIICSEEITIAQTGAMLHPVLLEYDVECPYRIEDAAFMTRDQILSEVSKWESMNTKKRTSYSLIAADVLIRNLRILHDNGILHNALTTHNYTWALELLDFEIAHSPNYPYTNEDNKRHVKDFFAREVLDVYKIIIYIAGVLHEKIDCMFLDSMFADYGFDLSQYTVIIK